MAMTSAMLVAAGIEDSNDTDLLLVVHQKQ
jgi:hypothetical protein